MNKKYLRYATYAVLLIALTLLAVRLFNPPDPLQELKKTERVTEAPEAVALVEQAVAAVQSQDRKTLGKLMLVKDGTEFQRYTAGLLEKPFAPVTVIGCNRGVHNSRADNLSVFVKSEPRNEFYQFNLQKNENSEFKIRKISRCSKLPAELKKR